SYVKVDDGVGTYRKSFGSDHDFDYHVGGASYSPITFDMSAGAYASAYVSMRVIEAVHADYVAETDKLARQWVSTSSGLTTPSYTFSSGTYQVGDVTGTEASLFAVFNSGSGWVQKNNVNAGAHTLSGAAETRFGVITAGTVVALPVELINFEVILFGENVNLNWRTGAEINNAFFTVERSLDNVVFEKIAVVYSKATGGNSFQALSYGWEDQSPLKGTSYYRLSQTDLDGTTSNSGSISVELSAYPNEFILFPNPSTGEVINIFITGEDAQKFTVSIFDFVGRQIHFSEVILSKDGTAKEVIYLKSKLKNGVYLVKIDGASNNFTGRLLVK
ncbi:MAG: hypothetical protein ACJA0Q_002192, partial [Saprospiraceae bacterium]